jgi:hypothetical protein
MIFLKIHFYCWLAPYGVCVPHLCMHYEKNLNTYISYTSKIFILEMFLTCVHEIPNLLSLNVKLHHYNFIYFCLSIIVTRIRPQLLIERKKWKLLQICKHAWMTLEDLLVLTFKNCSKNYDCCNPLSINQI